MGPNDATAMAPGRVRALVFDILGTVVDEEGTVARETRELFASAGLDAAAAARTVEAWTSSFDAALDAVRRGEHPWQPSDALRGQALARAIAELPESDRRLLGAQRTAQLATVGHRLRPWPDSAAALDRLAPHVMLVALTNGELAQTVDMAAAGGLRWHCIFTADSARAFKPDAALYQLPIRKLGLLADQTLFVAAHGWDLRAAAAHGYRTAFISRPGADRAGDDEFDLTAGDLLDLAGQLTPTDGRGHPEP